MTALMLSAVPTYLEMALGTVFGVFHAPGQDVPLGSAVLMCSPWGWDEVASYRSRKRWAERLAAAGHPTLRFDLPGTGDSGGMPSDPAQLEAWLSAIGVGAEWLRDSSGAPRVAGLGLGLGGLLAREAVARGAPMEELALWGSPATGKAFVRETRAFSRLQTWSSGSGADENRNLPEGWIEAGGFVLGSETIAALSALAPDDAAPSSLRRALLLDRDGIAVDSGIRERMEGAGVEVSAAAGGGWGTMVAHPERSRLAGDVATAVEDWLAASAGPASAPVTGATGSEPAETRQDLRLRIGERQVRESPWALEQPFGRVFGILAEPVEAPVPDVCAVVFNAGAVRNTGPNRMWAETARRWAARGVRTLRVDLEGIGEADGDETGFQDVAEFYIPKFEAQVEAVLDSLQRQGAGSQFILVGLCAGGYWSYRAALADPRVRTAILLNAGALTWHSNLLNDREARKLARVLRRRWWKKLLLGDVGIGQLRTFARSIVRKTGQLLARPWQLLTGRGSGSEAERGFDSEFDRLRDLDTRLTMAFSGEEPLQAELRAEDVPARLERWPNITLASLPGSDHTLRPLAAQAAARELLDRELEQALAHQEAAAPGAGPGIAQPDARQR
jgi:alpha-beta hydrolase superfamily lysophospholipase